MVSPEGDFTHAAHTRRPEWLRKTPAWYAVPFAPATETSGRTLPRRRNCEIRAIFASALMIFCGERLAEIVT